MSVGLRKYINFYLMGGALCPALNFCKEKERKSMFDLRSYWHPQGEATLC